MNEELKFIPARIKELREILDLSVNSVAEKIKVDLDTYLGFESGEIDIPISSLYEIAAVLGVDFTVLLTGDSPRMEHSCVVRQGNGIKVDRYNGYSFSSLAYNFKGKVMEPMLVSLSSKETFPKLVRHTGQEFNYILKGKVKVVVGANSHILEPGDSIYFDPNILHGQAAVDSDVEFLTVINETV